MSTLPSTRTLLLYCPYDRRVTRHTRRGTDRALVCTDCGRRVDIGPSDERPSEDLSFQRTARITPIPVRTRPRVRPLQPARSRAPWAPVVLVLAITGSGILFAINRSGPAAAPEPASSVVEAAVPVTAPAPSEEPPVPPATATTLEAVRIANTGGVGAYVRRTPRLNDRLRAWPDNTLLKIRGPDTTAEGIEWKRVEDPAGNQGWIPAQYTRPEPAF